MINYDEKYNKKQLEKWYLKDGLTLEQLGQKLGGLSRQSAANRLARCGIKKVRSVEVECSCGCKETFVVTMSRFNRAAKIFKDQAHYARSLRGRKR